MRIKHFFTIMILVLFSNALCSQELYMPYDGQLPSKGRTVRLGPMRIIHVFMPSMGIKKQLFDFIDPEKCKEYYGYVEFGEYFLQYELYKTGQGLIVKQYNISNGKYHFIKKETDKFYTTTYQWSANSSSRKQTLFIRGCETKNLCIMPVSVHLSDTEINDNHYVTNSIDMIYDF